MATSKSTNCLHAEQEQEPPPNPSIIRSSSLKQEYQRGVVTHVTRRPQSFEFTIAMLQSGFDPDNHSELDLDRLTKFTVPDAAYIQLVDMSAGSEHLTMKPRAKISRRPDTPSSKHDSPLKFAATSPFANNLISSPNSDCDLKCSPVLDRYPTPTVEQSSRLCHMVEGSNETLPLNLNTPSKDHGSASTFSDSCEHLLDAHEAILDRNVFFANVPTYSYQNEHCNPSFEKIIENNQPNPPPLPPKQLHYEPSVMKGEAKLGIPGYYNSNNVKGQLVSKINSNQVIKDLRNNHNRVEQKLNATTHKPSVNYMQPLADLTQSSVGKL